MTVGDLRLYPQRNCLDRETALRMWTENVTWFSNEEGKKGRIEVGQFADLIVPDRDFLSCAEDEIADTMSELTIVPPVRNFGGDGSWVGADARGGGRVGCQSPV